MKTDRTSARSPWTLAMAIALAPLALLDCGGASSPEGIHGVAEESAPGVALPAVTAKATVRPEYRFVEHSERPAVSGARVIGVTEPDEKVSVTVAIRHHPGAPALPGHSDWMHQRVTARTYLDDDAFAATYGAAQDEVDAVASFGRSQGLVVTQANVARRSVILSGTAAAMGAAFGITLLDYDAPMPAMAPRNGIVPPASQVHRGFEGRVQLPAAVADVVDGIYGLDNRSLGGGTNGTAVPPNTTPLSVPQVVSLYDFPTNSAAGQTIGIVDLGNTSNVDSGGYKMSDVNLYYKALGGTYKAPSIVNVMVDGFGNLGGSAVGETTLDIDVASTVAQGAKIAVYFSQNTEAGWLDMLDIAIYPAAGDPKPSVFTTSWVASNRDDSPTIGGDFLNAVSGKFQEAAARGISVFAASGDEGSFSNTPDGKAHVQYPGSDPWVTSCGGTTISNVSGSTFTEVAWNDSSGTTGGGVSDFFPVPQYQKAAGLNPINVSYGVAGRGVPDVAGNASGYSGYTIFAYGGMETPTDGTSQVAPLYAGLAATLNAALKTKLGFLNPTLYEQRSAVMRDITSGNNQYQSEVVSAPFYTAGPGWDAVTGLGVIQALVLGFDTAPYARRILDTPTGYAEGTAGTWVTTDWDRDGIADLAFIQPSTPGGHVQVSILSGSSKYKTSFFINQPTTFLNETDGTWTMTDWDHDGIPDLVFIKTANTQSGDVEVHIASGKSAFATRIVETPTVLANETDGNWMMADVDDDGIPDLVFLRTSGSQSGKIEVHVAQGFLTFTQRLDWASVYTEETDGTWTMADYDRDGMADLVFIKTSGTTGNVEVHMASGVSNYKTKLLDTTSPFTNETDGTWTMGDVDGDGIPDLVFVRTANSASQKVEMHAAAGG